MKPRIAQFLEWSSKTCNIWIVWNTFPVTTAIHVSSQLTGYIYVCMYIYASPPQNRRFSLSCFEDWVNSLLFKLSILGWFSISSDNCVEQRWESRGIWEIDGFFDILDFISNIKFITGVKKIKPHLRYLIIYLQEIPFHHSYSIFWTTNKYIHIL